MKKLVVRIAEKVMLAAVVSALLVLAVPAFLVAPVIAVAETVSPFTITGYGPEESALKGDQEKQALKIIEGWGKKKPVRIIVYGFADKSGTTAKNDEYSKKRAEEVKNFFEEKYPEVKVITRSKGDSANARKVVVTVEFAATTSPLLPLKFGVMILVATILISVIFVLLLLRKKGGNNRRVEWITNIPAKAPVYPEEQVSYEEELSEEVSEAWVQLGEDYEVLLVKKNGNWEAPFTVGGVPIVYPGLGEARRQLGRQNRRQYFDSQVNNLFSVGSDRIRIKLEE